MKMKLVAGAALLLAYAAPAMAADPGCKAYIAQSDAINADLTPALALMQKRDVATATLALPVLEAHLAQIPAAPVAPLKCRKEIFVYDHHQFVKLTAMQVAGAQTGFPKKARFVEKALPFTSLAYAVGWLKYEAKDYAGARIAYNKGLAIEPQNHALSAEMAVTLLNLKAYGETIGFVQNSLSEDSDAPAAHRAKMLAAKAVAQSWVATIQAARDTVAEALRIDPGNSDALAVSKQLSQ